MRNLYKMNFRKRQPLLLLKIEVIVSQLYNEINPILWWFKLYENRLLYGLYYVDKKFSFYQQIIILFIRFDQNI